VPSQSARPKVHSRHCPSNKDLRIVIDGGITGRTPMIRAAELAYCFMNHRSMQSRILDKHPTRGSNTIRLALERACSCTDPRLWRCVHARPPRILMHGQAAWRTSQAAAAKLKSKKRKKDGYEGAPHLHHPRGRLWPQQGDWGRWIWVLLVAENEPTIFLTFSAWTREQIIKS
jgi:hypothetical protein